MVKTDQRIIQLPSEMTSSKTTSKSPSSSSSTSACKKKKFKGVRMRSWGSWVSEIRAPNQKTRIWLGSYSTAEAAARAYDAALLCLKGSSANLNFPTTASSHFIPQEMTVMSPKSIQRVAAAAANNNVATTTANIACPPSPPPQSSSSSSLVLSPSLVSSPSMSSSPSINLIDDDMSSLMGSFGGSYTPTYYDQANDQLPMSSMDSWNNFDQMFDGALLDPQPPMMYDFYEESDIRLWSFC